MTMRLKLALPPALAAYVKRKVESGEFEDASSVVSHALFHMDKHDEARAALCLAIKEGEESGEAQPFDIDDFLSSAKVRRKGE